MRAIYNHTLDSYTGTPSSEYGNFPFTYAQDIHLDTYWRTTDVTDEDVVFDAGAGETFTFDCVAIAGHNLTSGATIKFQMNATNAWGAPSVDETVTWRSGIMIKYFTSSSYRYCRFSFADATNTDGYIEIARLSASEYLQFNPSSLREFTITNNRPDLVADSISNQMYANLGVSFRTFSYQFPPSSFTMIDEIRTMYNLVGMHTPFFFMNYDTRFTEIEPAYVRITNQFTESWEDGFKIGYNLNLRETA